MRRIGRSGLWWIGLSAVMMSSPAMAEVCDKENPQWTPASGPAGPFSEAASFLLTPFGIAVAVLLALALVTRRRPIYGVSALASGFSAWAVSADPWFGGDATGVYAGAVAEGCRSSPVIIVVILAIAAAYAAYRMIRPR